MKTFKYSQIYLLGIVVFCFFILVKNSVAADDDFQEQQIIQNYQENRQNFREKQEELKNSFEEKRSQLQAEIADTQEIINDETAKIRNLEQTISSYNQTSNKLFRIQNIASVLLFPEATFSFVLSHPLFQSLNFEASKLLYFFLSVTLINLSIYYFRRYGERISKYKVLIITSLVIMVIAISSPLFAAEFEKRQRIIDQLEVAEKVLSLSNYQRFIAILESKQSTTVSLPRLESGHPLLDISRRVKIDTPEYWYSLAGLYYHEGRVGKAVEAIKELTQESVLGATSNHRRMLVNSIKFLIEINETELASQAVKNIDERILSATELLDLASLLQDSNMRVSAEKVLGYAVKKARRVSELLELSEFLMESNASEKAAAALNKATFKASSINEFLQVATFSIENGKDAVLAKLMERVSEQLPHFGDRMMLVDLFIKNGRKEEAIMVFAEMIRSVQANSYNKEKALIYLIEQSLERGFLAQTADATEKLYIFLGKQRAFVTKIEEGFTLESSKGLPDRNEIMLPQFYGLINEERGYNDEAETAYIQAVSESLNRVLNSYGYKLPDSLNDYHLLGRLWAMENRADLLLHLDRVYTIIENLYIQKESQRYSSEVERYQSQQRSLQQEHTDLLNSVNIKRKQLNQAKRTMILQAVSTVATLVLVLSVLVGCIVLSYAYAKKLSDFKTFGFFSKLVETRGWIGVMSVIGAVSGLVSILVAQFLLIFQKNQENTFGVYRHLEKESLSNQREKRDVVNVTEEAASNG